MTKTTKFPAALFITWCIAAVLTVVYFAHHRCGIRHGIKYPWERDSMSLRNGVGFERLSWWKPGWRRYRRLFNQEDGALKTFNEFGALEGNYPRDLFRANASVLSSLAQFNHGPARGLVGLFEQSVTCLFEVNTGDYRYVTNMVREYIPGPEALEKVNRSMKTLDLGIDQVSIDSGVPRFKLTGFDKEVIFSDPVISATVRKLFILVAVMHHVLDHGGVLVVDSLDGDIHIEVMEEILGWFRHKGTNPHNAQLLIASHHASLMEILEKEEIYFTEKNMQGTTNLYGLRDIERIRRSDNFYRKYRAGVFGAVPNIG